MWTRWLILCSALGVVAAPVRAGEQYAFLVGVGGYDEKQLRGLGEYPRSDVVEFRDVLVASGVKRENIVLLVDDLDAISKTSPPGRYLPEAVKIRKELQLLLPSLERDDTLIIGLAGHGVQFKGDAEPYFCPSDADLKDKRTLISLTWLYDQLKYDAKTDVGCKPRQKLLMVDACRNDPGSRLFRDAGGPELESVTKPQLAPPPEGVVALFSCAEGQQALQHDPLKHGIFFYHVLEGWKGAADGDQDQQVTLDEIIAYTKSQTQKYARLKLAAPQTPRQKGYFEGNWILRTLPASDLITNTVGMKLKRLPAGEFLMGSTPGDVDEVVKFDPSVKKSDLADEQPQHRVRITQPYYLGLHEVTKGEFAQFVNATGHKTEAETDGKGGWGYNATTKSSEQDVRYSWRATGFSQTDSHPVVNVTWNDAVAFCAWLSRQERKTYRLPTEAEWEYACRAGTQSLFATGSGPASLEGFANVRDASFEIKFPQGDYGKYPSVKFDDDWSFTSPAGRFKPNAFGLYDMHGNVWEWCQDVYDAKAYERGGNLSVDPAVSLGGSVRVRRGGGWSGSAWSCRSAARDGDDPSFRGSSLGFRVLLSPSGD